MVGRVGIDKLGPRRRLAIADGLGRSPEGRSFIFGHPELIEIFCFIA